MLYCSLAHSGMNVISNGRLTPCCAISANYLPNKDKSGSLAERMNHVNMIRVRSQLKVGIWPSECDSCKTAEEVSGSSLRTMFNAYNKEQRCNTVLKPTDVHTVHLSVGNKCNSKCMTCNPGSSSLWKDEWQTIWDIPVISTSDSILEHPELVDELVNNFTNIKKITFLGGEPTINDSHISYLHKLIDNGSSTNIDLGYVTNLTGIDDSLLEIWGNFRNIELNVSMDAYGEKNDYIRYPIKWSKIEYNLNRFLELTSKDKISIGLSLTPSVFNCIHLDEMFTFWDQLLTRYNLPKHYGIALNKITYPMYTSMRITSVEYRMQGIEKLSKLKHTISSEFHPTIDHAIDMLKEPMLDIDTIDKGKHFIEQSDLYRNKSIRETIPELYNELWQTQ